MKNTNSFLLGSSLFSLLLVCLLGQEGLGQCIPHQISHTSGTEPVGCVDVTVISDGSVLSAYAPNCSYGPFVIGPTAPGSYTLFFSSPVSEIWVNFEALNNFAPIGVEELSVEINGAFYPMTSVGSATGCGAPLPYITASGTLGADPIAGQSSSRDLIFSGSINSIKIENIYISGTPLGIAVSVHLCCPPCATDAGEIPLSMLNLCIEDIAMASPAEQFFLEGDDLLKYILFSDPVDTLGSITQTNNIPEFAFDPSSMTAGTAYYIAAIAGNDVGGNVDLTDDCLDISNAIEVVWHPDPSVEFTSSVTDVCADGCYDIGLNFIGTPPFQLQWEIIDADDNVEMFNETFNNNMATYNICLPPNTPIGNVIIEATSLTDNYCTCN